MRCIAARLAAGRRLVCRPRPHTARARAARTRSSRQGARARQCPSQRRCSVQRGAWARSPSHRPRAASHRKARRGIGQVQGRRDARPRRGVCARPRAARSSRPRPVATRRRNAARAPQRCPDRPCARAALATLSTLPIFFWRARPSSGPVRITRRHHRPRSARAKSSGSPRSRPMCSESGSACRGSRPICRHSGRAGRTLDSRACGRARCPFSQRRAGST